MTDAAGVNIMNAPLGSLQITQSTSHKGTKRENCKRLFAEIQSKGSGETHELFTEFYKLGCNKQLWPGQGI